MRPHNFLRRALRCRELYTWTMLFLCTAVAMAEPASDPVEALRQALQMNRQGPLEPAQRERLTKGIAALQGIGEMARALELPEWQPQLMDPMNDPFAPIRTPLAERFKNEVRQVLKKGTNTSSRL